MRFSDPLNSKRAFPFGNVFDAEGLEGSVSAEHVTVCSHCISPIEQRVGIVVEVVGEATHHLFKIAALIGEVPGAPNDA